MSIWHELRLGDVCELKRGYDLPRASRRPGTIPIVSSSGRTGFHDEAKVIGPGVVTGRYGTLGEVFYIPEDFWPLNTALYVRDFKGNNPRYVAALLRSMNLAQYDGAAAVPGLNRNQLHTVPVRVPAPSLQSVIASVLAELDALIDNNRRRIEVLEDMARAIYREWFVHFRFPGHQNTPVADSDAGPVPDSWDISPFAKIASFVNGFAFKPQHWGDEGRPIIKIKELKRGVASDTPRCPEDQIDSTFWIEPGDLLFSWSADLGAYRWADEPGLLNQHLFVVKPASDRLSLAYLFHALDQSMPQFRSLAQGTTMRHIKRSALSEVVTVVPPSALIKRFTADVDPIHWESIRLAEQSRALASIRDRLLPKLVTGQIDISQLDLGALIEGAVA